MKIIYDNLQKNIYVKYRYCRIRLLGEKLVRNFNDLNTCNVKYVCEKEFKNAEICKKLYDKINVVNNYNTLLEDESIDAIVIAKPVDSHF